MKNLFLFILLLIQFILPVSASDIACKGNEIKIRASYVDSYKRLDGTPVTGYYRKQFCRRSKLKAESITFEDQSPKNWKFQESFMAWSEADIKKVLDTLDNLPQALRNQKIRNFYRSTNSIFPNNPAATLPVSREIVLYNNFFASSEMERILAHEVAHILYGDLTSEDKVKLAQILGWTISPRIPPARVIYPDSIDSPAEDIANNVEAYFYDSENQLKFNKKIPEFIKSILEAHE